MVRNSVKGEPSKTGKREQAARKTAPIFFGAVLCLMFVVAIHTLQRIS